MCDRPDKVYKYLNAKRVQDVLTNLKIRFSPVSSLNDATEFTPPTLGVGEREAILKAIRGRLEQKFPGLIAIYRNLYPDHVVEDILQGLAEKGALEVEENFEKSRDRIYEQLDRNFGVLSLSDSPVQRLMWAHYGDGERGYLIEFDAKHAWFSQERGPGDGFRHLRPVKYVATRDPKYIFDLDDEAVLYTKNSEYAWEHEWRMILNFNEAAAKLGADAYGIDVLLFSVPPQCITGVVIGPRADPAVTATLKTLVHGNPDLAHVVFKKTVRINDEITLLPDDDIAAHRR